MLFSGSRRRRPCAPAVSLLCLFLLLPFATHLTAADQDRIQIRLEQIRFDPVLESPKLPPSLIATGAPRAGSDYYLVQFDGPIRPEWRARLIQRGAVVIDYLPDFAYIVRMDEGARGDVQGLTNVRWVDRFQPAFRLNGELAVLAERPRAGAVHELVVRGFAGEPAADIAAQLAGMGATIVSQNADSGGGAIFRVIAPESNLADMAHVPAIAWIEPDYERTYFNEIARSAAAMNQDGLEAVLGLYGEDQIIAVGDTGVSTGNAATVHQDFEDRVFAGGTGPGSTCGGWADNHGHGTHVAGSALGSGFHSGADIPNQDYAGSNAGIAPEALLYAWSFCNDFSGLPDAPYADYYGVIRNSDPRARVNTNSWGYTSGHGGYNTFTRETDRFVWDFPDMVLTYAAGNDGRDANGNGVVNLGSMSMPATAKNVITVGASENLRLSGGLNPGNPNAPCTTWGSCWPGDFPASPISGDQLSDDASGMAAFSGRGPTNSDRLKPDIVAPGSNIVSARNESTAPPAWAVHDAFYRYNLGTSMATPLVAGASAIVRQFYDETYEIDPGAALVKATLINGAFDMTPGQYGAGATQDVTLRPDNNQGWGRVDMVNSLVYDDTRSLEFVEHAGLDTGENFQLSLFVGDAAPLRATLVWADFPGTEVSAGALTNDLDLIVQAPDGTYLGNHVITGGTADRNNNVEGVDLDTPVPGEYTIIVEGFNVPEGPQPFALVLSGNFGGFSVDPPSAEVCTSDGSIDFTLTLSGQFDGTTNLSADGVPAGASGSFAPNPVVFPDDESVFTLGDLEMAAAGDHVLELTATDDADAGNTATVPVPLGVYDGVAAPVDLLAPVDGATGLGLQPDFDWMDATATEYQLQVAEDAGFTVIVIDEILDETTFTPALELDTGSDYFWRVRGLNVCGDGGWSDVFAFQTHFVPIADVTPGSFTFELPQGGVDSDTLSVTNAGTGNLVWSIFEAAAPSGVRGVEVLLEEDFSGSFPPSGWGIQDVGTHNCPWMTSDDYNMGGWSGSTRGAAVDSDDCFPGVIPVDAVDSSVISPSIDLSTVENAELSFDFAYRHLGSSRVMLDVSTDGGGSWTTAQTWNSNFAYPGSASQPVTIDLSAYDGEPDVTLRWRYRSAWDWWVYVDNVMVTAENVICDAPSDIAWLSADPDGGSTPGGETDEVSVTVDAMGLAEGEYEAYLCLTTNADGQDLIPIQVELTVTDEVAGQLAVDPDALPFGDVDAGDSSTLAFTVGNAAPGGSLDIELSAIEVTAGDEVFAVTGGDCMVGTVLAPGADCEVEVTFSPDAAGPIAGEVTVSTVQNQSEAVSLSGTGLQDPGELEVSPQELEFGGVATGGNGTGMVTVSNIAAAGAADLALTQIEVISGQADFAIGAGGNCGATLAAQASCTVAVQYTPTGIGSHAGVLRIVGDGDEVDVNLSGEGIEPEEDIFSDRFEEEQ